jgi:hypothetical protein
MLFARYLRRWLAGSLVFALLFMQLASAAYACPVMSGDSSDSAMPCAEMSGASAIVHDMDQPGLCAHHCQPPSQSFDSGHLPALAAPAIVTMLVMSVHDEQPQALAQREQGTAACGRAPPALSILHCCFRI